MEITELFTDFGAVRNKSLLGVQLKCDTHLKQ